MPEKIKISEKENYIEFTLYKDFSVHNLSEHSDTVVNMCIEKKCSNVLLDFTELKGKPSLTDLYEISINTDIFRNNKIKVAVFGLLEQMHPDKIGEFVTRKREVNVCVFTNKNEAVEWLLKD